MTLLYDVLNEFVTSNRYQKGSVIHFGTQKNTKYLDVSFDTQDIQVETNRQIPRREFILKFLEMSPLLNHKL